jgi:hypothetical protein
MIVRPALIKEVGSGIDGRGSHNVVTFRHGCRVYTAMGDNASDSALLRHAIATESPVVLRLNRFGRFSAQIGRDRGKARPAAPGEYVIGPGAGHIVSMKTGVYGGSAESASLQVTFQRKRGGRVLSASTHRAADRDLLLGRLASNKPVVLKTVERYGDSRFSVVLKGPASIKAP